MLSGEHVSESELPIVIIGAGPYGLSIAAHLSGRRIPFRIFGEPMLSWRNSMPKGMLLKSEGFASDLYDPDRAFTLGRYCSTAGIPYEDVGTPVALETFAEYGLEFQQRLVPELERTAVTRLRRLPDGFVVSTVAGDTVKARAVIVAAGITHFAYIPPELSGHPDELVTHSSAHTDPSRFKGRPVAIIGGGASAVDLAALMHEAGVDVKLVARRRSIDFHEPTVEPRSLMSRLLAPRSGLGLGWRSRLCTDAPLLFHTLPEQFRIRVVQSHLGPAPGWFMKDRIVGKVPVSVGRRITGMTVEGGRARLALSGPDQASESLTVDHVVAATGYKPLTGRLPFLDDQLRGAIRTADGAPALNRNFESSVPGLYFIGLASANSFGPLARFAFGAGFTATRLARHLSSRMGVRGRRGSDSPVEA